MHPLKAMLRRYIDGLLEDESEKVRIEEHLGECEFCREYCENYRELNNALNSPVDSSPALDQLANRLYKNAFGSNIVELSLISSPESKPGYSLAADGEPELKKGIYSLATLGSEDPEVVLKNMRDTERNLNYIQLLSEQPKYSSNVLIQIPEINREIFTDHNGRADLETSLPEKIAGMKWQIKLPDAGVSLSPIKYDPDKTEYQTEQVLETERNDKILIRFEGKTGGKKIILTLLQLEGNKDFGPVRISVSQKDYSMIHRIDKPGTELRFDLADPEAELFIRLFADE